MALVTELDLPMFNLFDPDVIATLTDATHALIAGGGWLSQTPISYSVLDHEAVRDLLRDPRLRTMGTAVLDLQGITGGPIREWSSRMLLNIEGPDHTRQRRLVSRAFTPRAVDRLRPLMRDYVEERARAMAAKGGGDAVTELAEAYPIAVICALVGAPAEDWPRFSAWTSSVFKVFNFQFSGEIGEIETAITELDAYIEALIERRRDQPADDLLSTLLAAEDDGERLSHRELVDLVSALLLAGTDTTRNQLGLGLIELAAKPDEWARLVADPTLVPLAVEELLRFRPTVAATPRVVVEELEYRGVTFPVGTLLTLVMESANRDPAKVTCPMDLDVGAERGSFQLLSFGNGAHYCLGANLARAELVEAFDVLARTWRSFELAGEPVMKPPLGLSGPLSLPLEVTPR